MGITRVTQGETILKLYPEVYFLCEFFKTLSKEMPIKGEDYREYDVPFYREYHVLTDQLIT